MVAKYAITAANGHHDGRAEDVGLKAYVRFSMLRPTYLFAAKFTMTSGLSSSNRLYKPSRS